MIIPKFGFVKRISIKVYVDLSPLPWDATYGPSIWTTCCFFCNHIWLMYVHCNGRAREFWCNIVSYSTTLFVGHWIKHCHRHNGPEGRVQLNKVTSLGLITSSNTSLDQISSSDRPTKHQPQNLDQTSASRLNLRFKILTKPNFITSTKHQREITDQTPASEHCLRAVFQSWFHLGIWHIQNT